MEDKENIILKIRELIKLLELPLSSSEINNGWTLELQKKWRIYYQQVLEHIESGKSLSKRPEFTASIVRAFDFSGIIEGDFLSKAIDIQCRLRELESKEKSVIKKKRVEKIIIIIRNLMLFLCLIEIATIFACHGISNAGVRFVSSKIKFPLNLCSFDVGDQGEIVCFSNIHNRIQLFSRDGQFRKGWFVDNGGATGVVLIDSNSNIHFATPNDRYFIFDFDGNVIEDSREKGLRGNMTQLKRSKSDQRYDNCVYKMKSGIRGKVVVKKSPEGHETVVVSMPFYIYIFGEAFPWLAFFFLLSFFMTIWEKAKNRKELN